MGQKSSIDRLDPKLRKQLQELLKNPAVTQLEVVETINEAAGGAVVSKSSVNRYKLKMDKFIEKNRQAREVADSYFERCGDDSRNKIGKLLNEQIRMAAYDFMTELEELKNDGKINPVKITGILLDLSKSIKELEQAEKLNAERAEKIRKQVLEETLSKVEDAAEKKLTLPDVLAQLRDELTGKTNAR